MHLGLYFGGVVAALRHEEPTISINAGSIPVTPPSKARLNLYIHKVHGVGKMNSIRILQLLVAIYPLVSLS